MAKDFVGWQLPLGLADGCLIEILLTWIDIHRLCLPRKLFERFKSSLPRMFPCVEVSDPRMPASSQSFTTFDLRPVERLVADLGVARR